MSLQTKVFTYGSLSSKVFKYYALELTLTENSVSQDNNTSEIAYTLKLKTGANNQFDGRFDCVLKLNGSQVASVEKKQMFAYNKIFTLLSGVTTVAHGADGSLNMPIAVVVDTAESNPYSPDDVTIDWSWALTTIPRASSITSAAAVTLGNACNVKWTPNSKSFRYKLKFTIDGLEAETGAIHPNKTSAYTYTGYTLPLDIAKQITAKTQGTMTVTLNTFSDSSCKNLIGTDIKTFKVTVPDNAETQPTVEMELAPVSPNAFDGLYVQKLSKVKATALTATAKYGAEIKSTYVRVESKNYSDPYQSSVLANAGEIEIMGYAVDSRGIIGTVKQSIQVLPYYAPKLTATAYRCNSAGEEANDGEYLKIEATRDYAPVMWETEQKNCCAIWYRYKSENADDYSAWVKILDYTAEGNTVETEPLLNATFSKDTSYAVQIHAKDYAGKKVTVTVNIASERVFRHKRAGGLGMGLGGYCEEDNLLDVHWNQRVRKDLNVEGSLSVGGKSLLDRIYPVGSIYMSVTACKPGELFGGTWVQLKDRFLLAAGDTYAGGKTGGEETVKLTIDTMPSHTHKPTTAASPDPNYPDYRFQTITDLSSDYTGRNKVASGSDYYVNAATPDNHEHISGVKQTAATGGDEAHNNMPPYLTVYMYKRTA